MKEDGKVLHSIKKSKLFLVAMFLTLLTVIGTACSNKSSKENSNDKIKITATTDFYGEVAKAVAGKKGDVVSVINKPNIDPHDYDPTPKVAKRVSGSGIVIANGIGYDSWMNKLVKNSNNLKYIKVGEDLMDKKAGDNPHLWYNPQTMPKLANNIAARLGKIQPKNKKYFKKNAKKYIASLKPVNNKISQLNSVAAKVPNKDVYVSEPVFDYAITAAGFKVGNPQFENDTEKGTDPAPKTIKSMQSGIKQHKIAFFVYNTQVSDKTITTFVNLAHKNNVPVLKVTETLPANKNYKQWMTDQYNNLLQILNEQ